MLQEQKTLLDAQAALRRRRDRRQLRSCWVRPWLSAERRLKFGHYDRLMAELRMEDQQSFFNFLIMPPQMFDELLKRVGQTPSPSPAFPSPTVTHLFSFPIIFPPCPPLVHILYPTRGSEERCELSHRVRAASPAAKRILVERRPKLGMALG